MLKSFMAWLLFLFLVNIFSFILIPPLGGSLGLAISFIAAVWATVSIFASDYEQDPDYIPGIGMEKSYNTRIGNLMIYLKNLFTKSKKNYSNMEDKVSISEKKDTSYKFIKINHIIAYFDIEEHYKFLYERVEENFRIFEDNYTDESIGQFADDEDIKFTELSYRYNKYLKIIKNRGNLEELDEGDELFA